MRYFIDTEFIELPWELHPISIGIVADDDREFYAVVEDFPAEKADPWVVANVIAKLEPRETWRSRADIAAGIRSFIGADPAPEFWGYFSDYDWVLFCWLRGGRMIDTPAGWPMFCLDLKQAMREMGIERSALPAQPKDAHNALADARWTKAAWDAVFVDGGCGKGKR